MTTPMTNEQAADVALSDLKPCPFCGGTKVSDAGTVHYSNKHEAFFADGTRITEAFYCNCMRCGISNRGLLGHQTKEIAIDKWNARADQQAEPVARVNSEGFIVEIDDLPLAPGMLLYAAPQPDHTTPEADDQEGSP